MSSIIYIYIHIYIYMKKQNIQRVYLFTYDMPTLNIWVFIWILFRTMFECNVITHHLKIIFHWKSFQTLITLLFIFLYLHAIRFIYIYIYIYIYIKGYINFSFLPTFTPRFISYMLLKRLIEAHRTSDSMTFVNAV